MLFCTIQYVLFLVAVFAIYWSMPWQRARIWLLLAASFFFYASWSKWLALLIGATTVVDYFIALGMESVGTTRRRKLLLWLSLLMNLGILIVFKYANFFLDSLRDAVEQFGGSASLPVLNILLPVGISFYTFEAINYTVDVYRGRIKAEKNLSHFMLFILFFPHLVAGPIVRAKDFLPQIVKPKRFSWPRLSLGLWLIVLGTIKKLAIADRMAMYSDPVFASPEVYSGLAIWLAALAFALQVYCDFSGYSDIAIGSAHLLGYKLAVNFRTPFLAANIAGILEALAYLVVVVVARLFVLPLGRQPRFALAYVSKPVDRDDAGGLMARGGLELHLVGHIDRRVAGDSQALRRLLPRPRLADRSARHLPRPGESRRADIHLFPADTGGVSLAFVARHGRSI